MFVYLNIHRTHIYIYIYYYVNKTCLHAINRLTALLQIYMCCLWLLLCSRVTYVLLLLIIKGSANDIGMDYDYALLELKKAHKRRHMKLGISPAAKQLPGKRVQFSGFDNDRPGQLVYRFCEATDETYDLLYQRCDAQPGASGSGVYTRMWNRRRRRWERKVIGIFSGHQWVDHSGTPQEFNVAVRITPLKFAQICYWIKGNYMDCREGWAFAFSPLAHKTRSIISCGKVAQSRICINN